MVKPPNGSTAMVLAALKGHNETLQLLLVRNETDINLQNNYGHTALTFAARNGHTDTVRMLLEAGIDINLKHINGKTAIDLASEKGHETIVRILREYGQVRDTNEDKSTPSSGQSSDIIQEKPELPLNSISIEPISTEILQHVGDIDIVSTQQSYPVNDMTATPPTIISQDVRQEVEVSSDTTPVIASTVETESSSTTIPEDVQDKAVAISGTKQNTPTEDLVSCQSYPAEDETKTTSPEESLVETGGSSATLPEDVQDNAEVTSGTMQNTPIENLVSYQSCHVEVEAKTTSAEESKKTLEESIPTSNAVLEKHTSKISSQVHSVDETKMDHESIPEEPNVSSNEITIESPRALLYQPVIMEVVTASPSVQVSDTIREEPGPSHHGTSASPTGHLHNRPYLSPSKEASSLPVVSGVSSSEQSIRKKMLGLLSKFGNQLEFWK
jgi:hypothetical protein